MTAIERRSLVRWAIAWVGLFAFVLVAFAFRSQNELVNCYLKAAVRYVGALDMFAPTDDGIGQWVYPPFMVWPVAPLALVPEWLARTAWSALLTTCVILSTLLIVRTLLPAPLPESERRRRVILLVLAAIMCHKHLYSPFNHLSHDWLVFLALASGFAASASRRDALAGAAFGIGAALKVTPGLFLPVLLVQRRWRAAFAMTATIAVCSVLPDLVRPAAAGSHLQGFIAVAVGASDLAHAGGGHWASWNVQAQNLAAIIARATTETPPHVEGVLTGDWSLVHLSANARAIVTVAALGVVALCVVTVVVLGQRQLFRRAVSAANDHVLVRLNETGAVACGMVLLAPHSSKYHFAIVYFAALSCLSFVARRRDPVVIVCVAVMALLGLPTGRDLVGKVVADVLLLYGSVGLFALAGLIGCTRIAWIGAASMPPKNC